MADFKTPNLCGASEELNTALSKIDDIKAEIESKLNSAASEAAAAFESKQADIKAGLDGLALDLPEIPSVNFQSELTGLVSDFDKTTIEGIAAFNNKLAELERDFGDALTKAGKSLDSLVTDATSAIAGGGDVCAVAPNLELPSDGSDIVEKAQGVKTALENAANEIAPTVTNNAKVELKKQELKTKAAAVKTGEVFVKADPVKDVEPVVVEGGKTLKVTTTSKSVTVESSSTTSTTTTGGGVTETHRTGDGTGKAAVFKKRKTQSDKGLVRKPVTFVQRFVLKGSINEKIWDDRKYKVVDDIINISLFREPFSIVYVTAFIDKSEADLSGKFVIVKDKVRLRYRRSEKRKRFMNIKPEFTGKQLTLKDDVTNLNISAATRVLVKYKFYSTVDPDYSG